MGDFETPEADRLGWQQLALQAVGDFLADAPDNDLPAINWTIAVSGAITGQVDSLTTNPSGMRAAFEAWAAYLDADMSRRTSGDGTLHLYGRFVWARNDLVRGAIRATIPPMNNGEGEQ